MKLGAHVTISRGLAACVEKAAGMGANCLQIFASPPRNWRAIKFTNQEISEFNHQVQRLKIQPVFLHSIYLVNLHTQNPLTRQKAIESVIGYMRIAEAIAAEGVIVHSHHPDQNFKSALLTILNQSPTQPKLIIEHSAVTTLDETLTLFDEIVNDQLTLCLDTCHLFAAGYDIRDRKVVDDILATIARRIGLKKLVVIHANDAKQPFGSRRDHHENIGKGKIGQEAFRLWLNHPQLKNRPFIIETPGFDDQGPDKRNLEILKSLV